MAIDFPNSPTNGDLFNDSGKTWTYSSATNSWDLTGGIGSFTISDAPPSFAAAGDVWFESDTSKTYIYYDSAWVEFGGETGPPGSFIVSDTAPSNPAQGATWYQSSTGRTFVYYDSFWVEYGANASVPNAGSDGQILVSDSSSVNGTRWQGVEIAGKNKIINGNMMVAQRGTSFTSTGSANNDDTYTLDRWYILSDGNDAIDVTQSTDAPTGGLNSIALDVETINKKFGIAQIIEQKNCIGLIGETVTLSFRAKVSSTTKLDNVKAAIVAWSGTADTVTSDIISAWGAEGTNPTLITNATYENTPANLGVTTSWARYSITAPVDTASTKNIIVFIWSDVTDTTLGDFLYVTDVQLEYGSVPTRFTMHGGNIEAELAACQRYYWRCGAGVIGSGFFQGTTIVYGHVSFPTEMRVAPTSFDVSSLDARNASGGATTGSNYAVERTNRIGTAVYFDVTGGTGAQPLTLTVVGSGYFGANAEL